MKPYASYKQSGVPWLGDVPGHWNLKRVKHLTRHTTGWTPPTSNRAGYDGPNLWATIADLGAPVIKDTKARISDEAAAEAGIRPSPEGSLLFSFKLSVGQVSIVGEPMYTNEAIATFLPSHEYVVGWAFYAFPVFIPENSAINIYGARLLNQQRINDALLPAPSLSEQQAIADYLDVETARIDTLIHEKNELIGLLREWRQSVIAEYTSGANQPHSKKATGNVHMPEIPSDWSMVRLGKYARIGNGSTPLKDNASYWEGGNFPWLNSAVVNRDTVDDGSEYVTDVALRACHLPIVEPGALLVALTGQGKTRGMAAKLGIVATINQHLAYVKPATIDVRVDYLLCLFERAYSFLRSESDGGGSTKGAITCEQIANLEMPLPPAAEQAAIEIYLANKLEGLRDMSKQVFNVIDRLQEYRSALITNAVTGKIDVRGFECPAIAEAQEPTHA